MAKGKNLRSWALKGQGIDAMLWVMEETTGRVTLQFIGATRLFKHVALITMQCYFTQ